MAIDNQLILDALRRGKLYADAARTDMLCKAGGYSEAALKKAQETAYWKTVMADCEKIDAVIKVVSRHAA